MRVIGGIYGEALRVALVRSERLAFLRWMPRFCFVFHPGKGEGEGVFIGGRCFIRVSTMQVDFVERGCIC